ncbi:hypothetical protein EJD97_002146, partial [Solanum chilense]
RAVMDSVVPYFANSSAALFITLDGRYDGVFQARWSVEGLRSITLKLLEFGYWTTSLIITTNQQEGPPWLRRSVMHFVTTLGQTFPSSFSSFTTMPHTDRNRHAGPSQAP